MANKYGIKRIKKANLSYRIFATDENINFTRHNLSVATIFSTFSFIWSLFRRKASMNIKSSTRETESRSKEKFRCKFMRINVARYSSWLVNRPGSRPSGDFLNSFFFAPLIKSLIKATSINQNSVSDCCGRVLRCSRQGLFTERNKKDEGAALSCVVAGQLKSRLGHKLSPFNDGRSPTK